MEDGGFKGCMVTEGTVRVILFPNRKLHGRCGRGIPSVLSALVTPPSHAGPCQHKQDDVVVQRAATERQQALRGPQALNMLRPPPSTGIRPWAIFNCGRWGWGRALLEGGGGGTPLPSQRSSYNSTQRHVHNPNTNPPLFQPPMTAPPTDFTVRPNRFVPALSWPPERPPLQANPWAGGGNAEVEAPGRTPSPKGPALTGPSSAPGQHGVVQPPTGAFGVVRNLVPDLNHPRTCTGDESEGGGCSTQNTPDSKNDCTLGISGTTVAEQPPFAYQLVKGLLQKHFLGKLCPCRSLTKTTAQPREHLS